MNIVEIFSSIQGEGLNMGKRATFIRLAGCNLSCSYCDTKYALSPKCGTDMFIDDVWEKVLEVDSWPNLVIFTGGEPLLQKEDIHRFVLARPGMLLPDFAVETNGTIFTGILPFYHVTISPKLSSACKDGYDLVTLQEWVYHYYNRQHLGDILEFKFVITCPEDLDEVQYILVKLGASNIPIIFQPNGFKEPYDQALRELLEWTGNNPYFKHRARVLPQLHRIMWGQKRGV